LMNRESCEWFIAYGPGLAHQPGWTSKGPPSVRGEAGGTNSCRTPHRYHKRKHRPDGRAQRGSPVVLAKRGACLIWEMLANSRAASGMAATMRDGPAGGNA
jgi:hypothetical protein